MYGQDQRVVYIRNMHYLEDTLKYKEYFHDTTQYFFNANDDITGLCWDRHLIGFCGQIFPYIILRYRKNIDKQWKFKHCYNEDAVRTFIEETCSKERIEKYYDEDFYFYFTKDKVERFFDIAWGTNDLLGRFFVDNKVPIFVLEAPVHVSRWALDADHWKKWKIIVNPQLSVYEFYKMKDSYTAYQELDMYMSGVLGVGEAATIDISDEVKKQQKGFDNWSFKTLPTKKK